MPYNINLQICFKFFKLSFSEDLDQEGIETYLGLPREKFQSENLCEKWDKRTLCRGYTVKVQSKGVRKDLHVFKSCL